MCNAYDDKADKLTDHQPITHLFNDNNAVLFECSCTIEYKLEFLLAGYRIFQFLANFTLI